MSCSCRASSFAKSGLGPSPRRSARTGSLDHSSRHARDVAGGRSVEWIKRCTMVCTGFVNALAESNIRSARYETHVKIHVVRAAGAMVIGGEWDLVQAPREGTNAAIDPTASVCPGCDSFEHERRIQQLAYTALAAPAMAVPRRGDLNGRHRAPLRSTLWRRRAPHRHAASRRSLCCMAAR